MGGAERTLYNLLKHSSSGRLRHHVVSMTPDGYMGERIRRLGTPVDQLQMRRGTPSPRGFIDAVRWLRRTRPDVVQTWMYHADLLGALLAPWALSPPVVWNIRASKMTSAGRRRSTPAVIRLCARLSQRPEAVVVNSAAGQQDHLRLGYRPRRWVLIRNGVDSDEFRPDAQARQALRAELGVAEDEILIGLIARLDPKKDHECFLQAAQQFTHMGGMARFVLCGKGTTDADPRLIAMLGPLEVKSRIHLLGSRRDVSRVTAALDVATLSSAYGEGFPNVVAEAMACEVPCVVTDVGDAALVVGEAGLVVPPGDAAAMARGWHRLVSMRLDERRALGRAGRQRVMDEYSLSKMVAEYEDLYLGLSAPRPASD